ncbi:MAG TPA: hypothetical protein DD416_06155 [Rhodobacteraceae bacterium]|nr:hypothetical protein [Paracoccaceae bacterium]
MLLIRMPRAVVSFFVKKLPGPTKTDRRSGFWREHSARPCRVLKGVLPPEIRPSADFSWARRFAGQIGVVGFADGDRRRISREPSGYL